MKIAACITARGGSKGIPFKNLLKLKGKTLIEIVATECRLTGLEVWLSTEDDSIVDSVQSVPWINVLHRPENLATDTASSDDVLVHFAENVDFDWVFLIQPTSPLLRSEDLYACLQAIETAKPNESFVSCYEQHWLPEWSMGKEYNWSRHNRPRRQDIEPLLIENGAFWAVHKKALLRTKLRYAEKVHPVEMPYSRSFQIDTEEDLKIIKKLMR